MESEAEQELRTCSGHGDNFGGPMAFWLPLPRPMARSSPHQMLLATPTTAATATKDACPALNRGPRPLLQMNDSITRRPSHRAPISVLRYLIATPCEPAKPIMAAGVDLWSKRQCKSRDGLVARLSSPHDAGPFLLFPPVLLGVDLASAAHADFRCIVRARYTCCHVQPC
jgi:hypothetical protein